MFELILSIISAGLQLWAAKEKHKYIDELTDLERRYRAEKAKPLSDRSDAVLDNLLFELCQLGRNFAAGSAQSKP